MDQHSSPALDRVRGCCALWGIDRTPAAVGREQAPTWMAATGPAQRGGSGGVRDRSASLRSRAAVSFTGAPGSSRQPMRTARPHSWHSQVRCPPCCGPTAQGQLCQPTRCRVDPHWHGGRGSAQPFGPWTSQGSRGIGVEIGAAMGSGSQRGATGGGGAGRSPQPRRHAPSITPGSPRSAKVAAERAQSSAATVAARGLEASRSKSRRRYSLRERPSAAASASMRRIAASLSPRIRMLTVVTAS